MSAAMPFKLNFSDGDLSFVKDQAIVTHRLSLCSSQSIRDFFSVGFRFDLALFILQN